MVVLVHSMDVALSMNPQAMVGRDVRVFWPDDEAWYQGTVTSYDPPSGQHHVRAALRPPQHHQRGSAIVLPEHAVPDDQVSVLRPSVLPAAHPPPTDAQTASLMHGMLP